MKTLFKILVILFVLVATTGNAQSKVSLSLHQYAGFNQLDMLARFKMQGNQFKYGFIIVYPEFEYADIPGIYKRYSANAGYTFNQVVINNLEVSASVGYGWIDRYGKAMFSWSGNGELAYKLHNVKFSLNGQLTERSDLGYFYGETKIIFSGFVGLEVNLF